MNLGKQQSLFFTEDPGTSLQILAGLLGLSAVTCLCAYLLIYNIMYLSVAGKVRYYGLLQTVGMTEKQIKNDEGADAAARPCRNGNRMSAGSAGILFPDPCSDKISGDQKAAMSVLL